MIHVAADGKIIVSDDQDIYVTPGAMATPTNLRLYSRDPSTFDPVWPGVYPDATKKMVSNGKLDIFAKEASWKVWYLAQAKDANKDSDWKEVLSVRGAFANQVTSNTLPVEPKGVYRSQIIDFGGDGICCKYRNGFIAITKKNYGSEKAVIFQHNGNFEKSLETYLVVSDDDKDMQVQKQE